MAEIRGGTGLPAWIFRPGFQALRSDWSSPPMCCCRWSSACRRLLPVFSPFPTARRRGGCPARLFASSGASRATTTRFFACRATTSRKAPSSTAASRSKLDSVRSSRAGLGAW